MNGIKRSKGNRERERGFLVIFAAILLIIFGLLGGVATYLTTSDTLGQTNEIRSQQAFYLAESGLEVGARELSAGRVSCAGMIGSPGFTQVSFPGAKGQFSVSGVGPQSPTASPLTSALTASQDSVTVNDASTYAPAGRIMIDRELIDYAGITGNTFVNVQRGVDGTVASPHAMGAVVGQYQCTIQSMGGVPSLSLGGLSLGGARTLQEVVQLGEAWVVGSAYSNKGSLAHWNKPAELSWTKVDGLPNRDFLAIAMLSYADAWIVGEAGTILRWNGNLWSQVASGTTQSLRSISCTASNHCMAVGLLRTFLLWNGITWSVQSVKNLPNVAYTGITCNASDDCWAVGAVSSSRDVMVRWNGSSWSRDPSNPTPAANLNSVSCTASNDCWAVGNARTFIRWNGVNWSRVAVPSLPNQTYRSVDCVSASDCWAVGDGGDTFVHWNGSAWARVNPQTQADNLMTVFCRQGNDCWAGDDTGSTFHWDGTDWVGISNTLPKAVQVYGIASVRSHSRPVSAWKEVLSNSA
jgi:Tfp pilus assembly protein PilX